MTSILAPPGKYRMRKDWSTNSIPQSVEEEAITSPSIIINNGHNNNTTTTTTQLVMKGALLDNDNNDDDEDDVNVPAASSPPLRLPSPVPPPSPNGYPPKAPRRSSLALNLLTGRKDFKDNSKRRRSIAVAFLGRKDKNQTNSGAALNNGSADEKKSSMALDNDTEPQSNGLGVFDGNDKDKKRRRSSWQNKFERRRRKGVTVSGDNNVDIDIIGEGFSRQKRHSWWTIFVPDNLKSRSRRASQDVGLMSRSAEHLSYTRSKSRSVDHGLSSPFDLDSLRSKVEGRFESIDKLNKDSEKKKSTTPLPTTTYTVGNRDTLTSVAARFDTTPSELTQINRLGSSFIYPGQQLLVPDKSKKLDTDDDTSTGSAEPRESIEEFPAEEKELLDGLRPTSPRPGHIERVVSPNLSKPSGAIGEDIDEEQLIIQRFLKINVRHITDGQGVVGGVLLVTPNAVMFDPNVSDPLVIEHGPESYGVIAPMEFIVNAAIFSDIAHMRVGGSAETQTNEKPEIYYPKMLYNRSETHSPGKDSLVKDETFPELGVGSVDVGDDQESLASSTERDGAAFPKAFERELVTPNELVNRVQSNQTSITTTTAAAAATTTTAAAASDFIAASTVDEPNTKDIGNKTEPKETLSTAGPLQLRTLEERRRSLLDHHWAIPSKERRRMSCFLPLNSHRSTDDEEDMEAKDDSDMPINRITSKSGVSIEAPSIDFDDNSQMSKTSCHDSGIDIRETAPIVPHIPTKKVYSDADIVLSKDWVPPLTIAPTPVTDTSSVRQNSNMSQQRTTQSLSEVPGGGGGRKKTSSVSFSIDDNSESSNAPSSEKTGDKKTKMLKRLSYPLAWVEGLAGENKSQEESAPNTGDSNQSVFSKVFSRRSSIGTFMRTSQSSQSEEPGSAKKQKNPPQPKLDYRSMVSIDDMPALFVSFDKLLPRPARACVDPPMYLRLRMGRQLGKSVPLPTTVMSYGKNRLRPEYWFSVPKNKTDELFKFLSAWVPHLYGELDEETIRSRGFELIQHDTEWAAKGSPSKDGFSANDDEIKELTRESWEVLSMSNDDYRKAALFNTGSFDQDFPIPELIGQTEILTEEHREKLCSHLPARAEGYAWSLVFSTSQHGFSLNSLYRKMHKLESPVLIVIQDTENNVFGALTSCSLHVSEHFYGTGESLLYKFNPSFKVFHWSGENLYFIKGNPESLAIGAGDGKFGLWLDGDLNQGRSQSCSTYSNEALAPEEDFVIKTLECWAFV